MKMWWQPPYFSHMRVVREKNCKSQLCVEWILWETLQHTGEGKPYTSAKNKKTNNSISRAVSPPCLTLLKIHRLLKMVTINDLNGDETCHHYIPLCAHLRTGRFSRSSKQSLIYVTASLCWVIGGSSGSDSLRTVLSSQMSANFWDSPFSTLSTFFVFLCSNITPWIDMDTSFYLMLAKSHVNIIQPTYILFLLFFLFLGYLFHFYSHFACIFIHTHWLGQWIPPRINLDSIWPYLSQGIQGTQCGQAT